MSSWSNATCATPRATANAAPASRCAWATRINEHLRQTWSYSLIDRDLYDVDSNVSRFIASRKAHAAEPGLHHRDLTTAATAASSRAPAMSSASAATSRASAAT